MAKRGAAKKYEIDLDAAVKAGAKVSDIVIPVTMEDGSKHAGIPSKEVEFTDYTQVLAALSGNDSHACELAARAFNAVIQAPARVQAREVAQGAAKAAAKSVKAITAVTGDTDDAIATVIALFARKGTVVSAEAILKQLGDSVSTPETVNA